MAKPTLPVGAFVGIENGLDGAPQPAENVRQNKVIPKTVMFTSGGIAIIAAAGLYAIDRMAPA